MRLSHAKAPCRRGFTLVEMIVVIAIIAVLIALLAAGVMPFLIKGPELEESQELTQLTNALEQFKARYGFYPPSRIKLCRLRSQYSTATTATLDQESLATLNRMFPRLAANWTIDWSGGTITTAQWPAAGIILEGDQCLVFFLGGISAANPPGALGFSTNPQNPATPGGDRIRFFDFKSNRLVRLRSGVNVFYSYNNPHETAKAYAYFSAYGIENGYNRYGVSDCKFTTTSLGVSPYAEVWGGATAVTTRYLNPRSFQLISAGPNGQFGPGTSTTATVWRPATADQIGTAGRDDISNFHPNRLGVLP
jgi:general secretion pathway protein G